MEIDRVLEQLQQVRSQLGTCATQQDQDAGRLQQVFQELAGCYEAAKDMAQKAVAVARDEQGLGTEEGQQALHSQLEHLSQLVASPPSKKPPRRISLLCSLAEIVPEIAIDISRRLPAKCRRQMQQACRTTRDIVNLSITSATLFLDNASVAGMREDVSSAYPNLAHLTILWRRSPQEVSKKLIAVVKSNAALFSRLQYLELPECQTQQFPETRDVDPDATFDMSPALRALLSVCTKLTQLKIGVDQYTLPSRNSPTQALAIFQAPPGSTLHGLHNLLINPGKDIYTLAATQLSRSPFLIELYHPSLRYTRRPNQPHHLIAIPNLSTASSLQSLQLWGELQFHVAYLAVTTAPSHLKSLALRLSSLVDVPPSYALRDVFQSTSSLHGLQSLLLSDLQRTKYHLPTQLPPLSHLTSLTQLKLLQWPTGPCLTSCLASLPILQSLELEFCDSRWDWTGLEIGEETPAVLPSLQRLTVTLDRFLHVKHPSARPSLIPVTNLMAALTCPQLRGLVLTSAEGYDPFPAPPLLEFLSRHPDLNMQGDLRKPEGPLGAANSGPRHFRRRMLCPSGSQMSERNGVLKVCSRSMPMSQLLVRRGELLRVAQRHPHLLGHDLQLLDLDPEGQEIRDAVQAAGEELHFFDLTKGNTFRYAVAGPMLGAGGAGGPILQQQQPPLVDDSLLVSLSQWCSNLRWLRLRAEPQFTAEGVKQLAALTALEHLSLSGCKGLNDECFTGLVKSCLKLVCVVMDGMERVSEEALMTLCREGRARKEGGRGRGVLCVRDADELTHAGKRKLTAAGWNIMEGYDVWHDSIHAMYF